LSFHPQKPERLKDEKKPTIAVPSIVLLAATSPESLDLNPDGKKKSSSFTPAKHLLVPGTFFLAFSQIEITKKK
jgi:hypothetical protein